MADPFKPKFVDLVRTFTTTTGTGAIVPGAAVAGFASFANALVAGDIFYYCIQGIDKPAEREVGRGTLLANGTITRAPISGTATNFTTGNKTIALVAAAEWYARIDDGLTAAASAGAVAGQAAAATRVALAAMVVTAGTTAMLTEAGREGVFRFTSGNQAARVTGDPRQGMVVAPASDTTGASGAWLRIKVGAINVMWFGAMADFVVDDLPAFNAAMAAVPTGGGELKIPAGRYYLSDTLNLHKTVWLTGEGTDWNGGGGTILRFPPNKNGIVVNHYNTHGDGIGSQGTATGSTVEGIALWGGGVSVDGSGNVSSFANGTSTSGNGVRIRTTGVRVKDVSSAFFGGDGFSINSNAGGGGYSEGNANNFLLEACQSIYNRGFAYLTNGTDANAGTFNTCSAISCGGGGFIEYSFLGNTYIQCHVRDVGSTDPTASNGPVGACTYGGQAYYMVAGQNTAASTTVPGTNTAVWVPTGGFGSRAWVTGQTWVNGSSYGTNPANTNGRNVFLGCYSESSQVPAQIFAPSLIVGGLLAAGIDAGSNALRLSAEEGGGLTMPSLTARKGPGAALSSMDFTSRNSAWNAANPGNLFGGLHMKWSGVDGEGSSITFGDATNNAQSGIYTTMSNAYGTRMYLATSSSYASGSMTAIAIDEFGNVNIPRGTLSVGGAAVSRNPGVQAVTSAATVTPTFLNDLVKVTAQAAALTIANPTGTAVPGLGMAIRIKDNGTAWAISFGTQYRALGVTLPTTTVAGKTLYLGLIYNSDDTKWDVVAVAQEA